MKKDKKPDAVVYNEDHGTYDAHLKPYATNVGAPVIKLENIGPWKNKGIHAVNAKISAEFEEIRKKYHALQQRFEYNNIIYAAAFSFKPVVGKTYHLYKREDGNFLSILSPEECHFDFVGSFRLDSDYVWHKVP